MVYSILFFALDHFLTNCENGVGFGKHCQQVSSCHLQGECVATAMFAETFVNTQHSTRLTSENRSYTVNSAAKN
jgi:hypothetical protein